MAELDGPSRIKVLVCFFFFCFCFMRYISNRIDVPYITAVIAGGTFISLYLLFVKCLSQVVNLVVSERERDVDKRDVKNWERVISLRS